MRTSRRRTRAEYERGLPDYHDPTAGYGGAAPVCSALTLRIVLASAAILLCIAGAVFFVAQEATWGAIVLGVVGLVSLADLAWVVHRKRRGEPG